MTLKGIATINAVIAMVIGLFFSFFGPMLLPAFGASQIPEPVASDPYAMSFWSALAFARIFGATLFGFGTLLWTLRSITEVKLARTIALALFITNGFLGGFALIQQLAIWDMVAGWIMVGMFIIFALGYGYFYSAAGDNVKATLV